MSRNEFTGDRSIKLKRDNDKSDNAINTPAAAFSLSDNDKVMKRDNIIVRFVHIGTRFTGELQFKIDHPKKDVWYSAVEKDITSNDRVGMLTYDQREIVEYPISITLEEDESYESVINDFYNIIELNKPEGI